MTMLPQYEFWSKLLKFMFADTEEPETYIKIEFTTGGQTDRRYATTKLRTLAFNLR